MSTPMWVFAEIAARLDPQVDPEDHEAVDAWFEHELPKRSEAERAEILDELLSRTGEPPRPRTRPYTTGASVPLISECPEVDS